MYSMSEDKLRVTVYNNVADKATDYIFDAINSLVEQQVAKAMEQERRAQRHVSAIRRPNRPTRRKYLCSP